MSRNSLHHFLDGPFRFFPFMNLGNLMDPGRL